MATGKNNICSCSGTEDGSGGEKDKQRTEKLMGRIRKIEDRRTGGRERETDTLRNAQKQVVKDNINAEIYTAQGQRI